MSKDLAVKVSNVSKTFKLPHEKHNSIKGALVNKFRKKSGHEIQRALEEINFEVKKGEFFGIVGRNGSGKSTLLKLLAGIYTPDKGSIKVEGSLTPFIELGVGFNPELTGRENVFLNGALLGFNRKEISSMYQDIVDFAELERFMDQKLKNYSSGMQVRLAFSIAIRSNSAILLLDEVLAVGDAAFQQKCNDFFRKTADSDRTIVLVTHDMDVVTRYCDRAMLIENGRVKSIGKPTEIANQYKLDNLNTAPTKNKDLSDKIKRLDIKAISPKTISNKETFEFEVIYELNQNLDVYLGISLMYQGRSVIEHNTRELKLGNEKGKIYKIRYRLPLQHMTPKEAGIDVAIFDSKDSKLIGFNTNSCEFIITADGGPKGGIITDRGEWVLMKESA